MSGTARVAPAPLGLISSRKASIGVAVAVSALAIDSVEGQRARPSAVMRFDLLNVVGSSPARLARPDGDKPDRLASPSIADQICACVSIQWPPRGDRLGIITCRRPRLGGCPSGGKINCG